MKHLTKNIFSQIDGADLNQDAHIEFHPQLEQGRLVSLLLSYKMIGSK